MAKLSVVKGATSVLCRVFIQDSSSTTGAGLTGLVFNTSGLTCYRARDDDGNAGGTAITLATATKGTWTSAGFVEKDATNMPGWYEFGIPNNALATGSRSVGIHFKGATNMAPLAMEIELTGIDNQDAVRGGMTALPNANAEAAGGLYTRGTGAGQIKQTNNGEVDANATRVNNVATTSVTAVNANLGTAQPVGFTGTGGSALVKSDAVDIAGVASPTFPSNFSSLSVDTGGSVKIQHWAKKNVAAAKFTFVMTDNTNHAPATGKTVSVTRSIDGGSFAAGTLSAVTEIGSGWYYCDFASGDMNGNVIGFKATAGGCDDTTERIITFP